MNALWSERLLTHVTHMMALWSVQRSAMATDATILKIVFDDTLTRVESYLDTGLTPPEDEAWFTAAYLHKGLIEGMRSTDRSECVESLRSHGWTNHDIAQFMFWHQSAYKDIITTQTYMNALDLEFDEWHRISKDVLHNMLMLESERSPFILPSELSVRCPHISASFPQISDATSQHERTLWRLASELNMPLSWYLKERTNTLFVTDALDISSVLP